MSTKALLTSVYTLAKCFGIFPFRYQHYLAELTTVTILYSVIVSIVYNVLLIWSTMKFLIPDATIYNPTKNTKHLVLKFDTYSCIARDVSIYFSVIYHRELLVQTVNSVGNILTKLGVTFGTFLDKNCRQKVYVKVGVTLIQLIICIYLTFDFITFPNNSHPRIYNIKVIISSILTYVFGLIIGNVHFTAMLIIVQLFRIINRKLQNCMTRIEVISRIERGSMRMQMFCELSDQIDELSTMYKYIANCNKRCFQVMSLSIITSIMTSFVFITAGVIFKI